MLGGGIPDKPLMQPVSTSDVTDVVFTLPGEAATRYEPFRFTGTGGEYFRIWIVNVMLSVVTLGIYSAWAKVRRLRYFYRHTRISGASFDLPRRHAVWPPSTSTAAIPPHTR
jgi:hypothetical protein